MKRIISIFLTVVSIALHGQEVDTTEGYKGEISLGLRTTTSLFTNEQNPGLGTGGQFRIGLGKRVNTEWFADYIQSNIANLGRRRDVHIGWSVMYYPFAVKKTFSPYVVAGHCFDYTHVSSFSTDVQAQKRWRSATQAGAGVSWALSNNTDLTLLSQYMIHLGNDVHYHIDEHDGVKKLEIDPKPHSSLEGHLLVTLSLNIKIADLW